jgi:hypothetical protein
MGSTTATTKHRELTSLTRQAITELREKCLDLHNLVAKVDAASEKLDTLTNQIDSTKDEDMENASRECQALTKQMHEAGEIVDTKRAMLQSALKSLKAFHSNLNGIAE